MQNNSLKIGDTVYLKGIMGQGRIVPQECVVTDITEDSKGTYIYVKSKHFFFRRRYRADEIGMVLFKSEKKLMESKMVGGISVCQNATDA